MSKGMHLCMVNKAYISKMDSSGVCGEQAGRKLYVEHQMWEGIHGCCSDVPRQVSLFSCHDVFMCRTKGWRMSEAVSAGIGSAWGKFKR